VTWDRSRAAWSVKAFFQGKRSAASTPEKNKREATLLSFPRAMRYTIRMSREGCAVGVRYLWPLRAIPSHIKEIVWRCKVLHGARA